MSKMSMFFKNPAFSIGVHVSGREQLVTLAMWLLVAAELMYLAVIVAKVWLLI